MPRPSRLTGGPFAARPAAVASALLCLWVLAAAPLGEIATAPADSLILSLSVTRDAAGAGYVPRDVLDLVRRVSPVPVYGPSATYLGHGGGIGESELPAAADADVVYREPGFWTLRREWILAAVLLLAAQTALIVGLVAQRRKGASLERRLTARLRFETILSDVSAALGGVTVPRMEMAIQAALERIRLYLGVDRVSILELSADGRAVRTADNSADGSPPVPNDYTLVRLPSITLHLASLKPFVMDKVDDLPDDAAPERDAMRKAGIQSMVIVPLEVGGQSLGALSCISHTSDVPWSADRVQQVRTLGQVLANVIQRRQTDSAVGESDRLRGAILSSMSAQITVLDREGIVIAVNDAWMAFGRINGVRAEASISPGVSYLAVCERAASEGVRGAAEVFAGVGDVCAGRSEVFDTEYRLDSPDGERWFALKVVRLRRPDGGAVVTHRDITSDREREIALRDSERRFRLLADAQRDISGRLITAQEDERRRIARELHDDLQQRLALLAMELDGAALRDPPLAGEEVAACARDLWRKTVEISSEVHRLSHRLHPSKLEALGLLATVQSYCREFSRHGLQVTFTHDRVPPSIPSDVALCVFRVVQESLQNVQKHSGVTEARVTMEGGGAVLRVAIADAGRGFDATAPPNGGLGLVSMRERLHLVGGELTIGSAPRRGTSVAFEVPIIEEGAPLNGATPGEARL